MGQLIRHGLAVFLLSAVAALAAHAAGNDLDSLIRVLRDPGQTTEAKGDACSKLMDLGPAAKPAVPALAALLEAKDVLLRDYAVTTLGKIGPAAQAAVPALQRASARDPSEDIRQLAADALARIQGEPKARTAQSAVPMPTASVAATRRPHAASEVDRPPIPRAGSETGSARPPLEVRQGRYFRWAMPAGWRASESMSGVELAAPDGNTRVGSILLLGSPGSSRPEDFVLRSLRQLPGYGNLRLLGVRNQSTQPSGFPGLPWNVEDVDVAYLYRGVPVHSTWTCGILNIQGYSYNAFMFGYQAPLERFDQARYWLWRMARDIAITNPRQVAGNDRLITPRNHPLDNSGLIESWRQKGLSEDRISQARREATMGYEHMKDPTTGKIWDMPLETYDGSAGGYRNPERPLEILRKAGPGE